MSAISRHVTSDVTSNIGLGLVGAHIAIRDTLDGIRARRIEAADSVSELAIRLREARGWSAPIEVVRPLIWLLSLEDGRDGKAPEA